MRVSLGQTKINKVKELDKSVDVDKVNNQLKSNAKKTSTLKKELEQLIDVELTQYKINELEDLTKPVYLFFDQSTASGYSLWDVDGNLIECGLLKIKTSSLLNYKKELIKLITDLNNKYNIEEMWYEEVYDEKNKRTTEVLYYIKHTIKDLKLLGIDVYGFDHTTWKRELNGSPIGKGLNHKEEVLKAVKLESKELGFYDKLEKDDIFSKQDIIDAIGMGIARVVKNKDSGFLALARYSKKLPIFEKVYLLDDINEIYGEDFKLTKAMQLSKEIGGMYEVNLEMSKEPEDTARRFLSHKEALVVMKIPKNYRYLGIILLDNNIKPKDLEDKELVMLFSRKKRL